VGGLSSQTFGQSLINALKLDIKSNESVILDRACLRKLSTALPAMNRSNLHFINIVV
jgi:hypothetical protein